MVRNETASGACGLCGSSLHPETSKDDGATVGASMATSTRSTGVAEILGMGDSSFVWAWSRPFRAADNSATGGRRKPDA
jgi:hypothetical protein